MQGSSVHHLQHHMNTTRRTLIFGTASGLLWSLVPGYLDQLLKSRADVAAVLTVGVVTGVAVSFVLHQFLVRFNRWVALVVGILSLPAGAFCFGTLFSAAHLLLSYVTGEPHRFVQTGFHPFMSGAQYAVFSMISVFAVFLLPLAVLTTFLLRSALLGGPNKNRGAMSEPA